MYDRPLAAEWLRTLLVEGQSIGQISQPIEDIDLAAFQDRIRKWLEKAEEFARSVKATEFTITAGVPMGLSVSVKFPLG